MLPSKFDFRLEERTHLYNGTEYVLRMWVNESFGKDSVVMKTYDKKPKKIIVEEDIDLIIKSIEVFIRNITSPSIAELSISKDVKLLD